MEPTGVIVVGPPIGPGSFFTTWTEKIEPSATLALMGEAFSEIALSAVVDTSGSVLITNRTANGEVDGTV